MNSKKVVVVDGQGLLQWQTELLCWSNTTPNKRVVADAHGTWVIDRSSSNKFIPLERGEIEEIKYKCSINAR